MKFKCVDSDDLSAFVPGRSYVYDESRETIVGEEGDDWYYETHETGVIALCGLDIYFEVCND